MGPDVAEHLAGNIQTIVKLKADGQCVFNIISSDKHKLQTYCEIADLPVQLDLRQQDANKAGEPCQR